MVQKYGSIEELFIYYHPITNKHLGLGRVIFETVKGAKGCVEKLNNTSVMGKILQVFLDPFGEKCKKMFEEFIAEKKPPVVEEKAAKVEPEIKKAETEPSKKSAVDTTDYKERDRETEKLKEREELRHLKEKERERERDRIERDRLERDRSYSRGYVHSRNEFATPSSSDMGYNTAQSDFSASFGSAGTTPIQ